MNENSLKHKGHKRTKKTWYTRAFHWLVSAGLTISIVMDTQPTSAFGEDGWFGGNIHERITRNALPFMGEDILDTIVSGNLDEDEGAAADLAERHSQNCRFRDSAAYYNMRYRQVIEALREPQANDPDRAARLFGHLLHGIQDFYSHSNWIGTPPEGLGIRNRILDSGLGFWPLPKPYSVLFDDLVIIEGDPPKDVTVRLPADANGHVAGAVPIVQDHRNFVPIEELPTLPDWRTIKGASPAITRANGPQYRGLMTSGAPRHPGDQFCPPIDEICDIDSPENVCLRHGEKRDSDTSARAFDGAGRMNLDGGGGGDWFQARHHAKLQTRHEWCRLLHLSRILDPSFVATGRLLGTWVGMDRGNNTPHIPGTPCERGAERSHLVEISATPGADAPLRVPFVVFRSDFTSSARATVFRQATQTLRICGNTDERIVASLMPAHNEGATLIVSVPETAQSWIERDHRGEFSVSFAIKVTPNIC